jgi:hypothetical protein
VDPVVKQQWKNVAIFMGAKIGIMLGVRYAIRKYVDRKLAERLSSQKLQGS